MHTGRRASTNALEIDPNTLRHRRPPPTYVHTVVLWHLPPKSLISSSARLNSVGAAAQKPLATDPPFCPTNHSFLRTCPLREKMRPNICLSATPPKEPSILRKIPQPISTRTRPASCRRSERTNNRTVGTLQATYSGCRLPSCGGAGITAVALAWKTGGCREGEESGVARVRDREPWQTAKWPFH